MAMMNDEDIDPRVQEYLRQQLESSQAQQMPEYRASLSADRGAAEAGKRQNNLAALLARSSAMMGQVGGRQADSSGMDQYAKAQNANIDSSMAGTEKPEGLDPRILDYVKSRQNAETASADRATRSAEAKSERDAAKAEKNATAATAKTEKTDKETDSQFVNLADHIKGSVRDSLGAEKNKMRNVAHGMAIINGIKDPNNLTFTQMKDLAGVMAGQIAQGSPGESLIHDMTPETGAGNLSKVISYITGEPEPANQGEFVQQFKDMLQRQSDTSREIIQGELGPLMPAFGHLLKKDPARFKQLMSAAGADVDNKGTITAYQPNYTKAKDTDSMTGDGGTAYAGGDQTNQLPPPKPHPKDSQMIQWAKQNVGSQDHATAKKAQQVLDLNRGQ